MRHCWGWWLWWFAWFAWFGPVALVALAAGAFRSHQIMIFVPNHGSGPYFRDKNRYAMGVGGLAGPGWPGRGGRAGIGQHWAVRDQPEGGRRRDGPMALGAKPRLPPLNSWDRSQVPITNLRKTVDFARGSGLVFPCRDCDRSQSDLAFVIAASHHGCANNVVPPAHTVANACVVTCSHKERASLATI